MVIIHGDNTIASRINLNTGLDKLKSVGVTEIYRFDGKKILLEELIQASESGGLFNKEFAIVIDGFFSRPKSKERTALEKYLSQSECKNLYLYEGKKLTPTQAKLFKNATIQEAKSSPIVFSFLDNLGQDRKKSLQQLRECLKSDSASSVFFMTARHIRLLLLSTDPEYALQSWQKSKMANQVKRFGIEKIADVHEKLLEIDEKIKTGQAAIELDHMLELLVIELYD